MSAFYYVLACTRCGFVYATERPEATEGKCPTCVREEQERFDVDDPEIQKRLGRAEATREWENS